MSRPYHFAPMVALESVVGLSRVRELVTSGKARQIRIEARLSIAEVAASLGVTPAAVSRWESRHRSPRGVAALRYLDLLERLGDQSGLVVLTVAGGDGR